MLGIKSIRARAFRGIGPDTELKLDGKHLLLLGDNATGKSSLIEVLEIVLTGEIRRLSKRQRLSIKRHATHVNWKPEERLAEVVLLDNNNEYVLKEGKDFSNYPEKVKSFLATAKSGTFILTRAELLSFIDTEDRERYQKISPFLALNEYEKFEQLLKQAKEKITNRFINAKTNVQAQENLLRNLFAFSPNKDVTMESLTESFNKVFQSVNLPLVDSWSNAQERCEEIQKHLGEVAEDISVLNALNEVKSRLDDYRVSLPQKKDLLNLFKKTQQWITEESKIKGQFYEQVLTLGQKWIQEDSLSTCPLCEQPINATLVLERVQQRLDQNVAVIKARKEAEGFTQIVRSQLERTARTYGSVFSRWRDAKLPEDKWLYADLNKICELLSGVIGEESRCKNLEALTKIISDYLRFDFPNAQETIDGVISSKVPKDFKSLLEVHHKCQSCTENYPRLKESKDKMEVAKRLVAKADSLYEVATQARKEACEKILDSIKGSINDIYSKFHPDELVGGCSLAIKDYATGSVMLNADFADRKNDDPRGFFSESHLDTLGLAIFLALNEMHQKSNKNFRLLVLDDVLTSVDSSHRERIAKYLLTELIKRKQLIITTHNRKWYDWLIQIQNVEGIRDKFVNREITDWSLAKGPQIWDMEGDYEKLLKDSEKGVGHRFLVPIAGRLLEEILQALRFSLKLAVPAQPEERYSIGDIWLKFVSTCKKKYKALWQQVKKEVEELNHILIVRNWVTHYNESAKELSWAEAMQFVNAVLSLYPKIFCQECRSLIQVDSPPKGMVSCKKGELNYWNGDKQQEEPPDDTPQC